jgi:hypothetical protein
MTMTRDANAVLAGIIFPTTPEEARNWAPTIRRRALAQRVLAVATTRIEGCWAAYIDAVPGHDHKIEAADVLDYGSKLPAEYARVLFPEFADLEYAS